MFKKLKKPILIAEISANHCGKLSTAKKLIKCAKKNNADYVKFQSYEAESMTLNSKKKDFLIKSGLWKNNSLWDLYTKAQTPFSWHKHLFSFSKKNKIRCFSTPFAEDAVDILEKLNCPLYKISSFEMTDDNLISYVAKKKKPMIISTGLANIKEIDHAYNLAIKNGAKEIALLYCVSNYPANVKDFNLKNILLLKERYNCVVGLSDHCNNSDIMKIAIAYGAMIIEKHIALQNQTSGFDIAFSLRGHQIKKYAEEMQTTFQITKKNSFLRKKNELKNLKHRRSIYASKDIGKNELFTKENIKLVRPAMGMSPQNFNLILGKKAKKNIKFATPIKKNFIL